ncbi:DUF411 domain-containing protein [Ideonella sp.]|uniref:DUF411 domain-containing protein n=1 Tax=Ideonella sp. TaxID=1929293 RepID=UPI0039C86AD1
MNSDQPCPAPTRRLLALGLACAAMPGAIPAALATPAGPLVQVWKGPACGCCKDWVAHLEANGFTVKAYDSGNTDARERLHMPIAYGSCHTALVDGYALEGHVPAREIRRLLKERPAAIGLAVPAMPIGSPGMDGPAYGGRKDPYDVLIVARDGGARVYQAYR